MSHQPTPTEFRAGSDSDELHCLLRALLLNPDDQRVPLPQGSPSPRHLHDCRVPDPHIRQQLSQPYSLRRLHQEVHAHSGLG